jgi:hypothetical protein
MRNYTRDEVLRGRRSGADLKPPQAAVVKSDGGERCGKVVGLSVCGLNLSEVDHRMFDMSLSGWLHNLARNDAS